MNNTILSCSLRRQKIVKEEGHKCYYFSVQVSPFRQTLSDAIDALRSKYEGTPDYLDDIAANLIEQSAESFLDAYFLEEEPTSCKRLKITGTTIALGNVEGVYNIECKVTSASSDELLDTRELVDGSQLTLYAH